MALPIIAAGVAARYGAKKLAKYLVKRNTKKNVKTKKVDVSDLKFKNNDPFGNMSYKEKMGSIKQADKIVKKIAKKRGFKIPSDKIPY